MSATDINKNKTQAQGKSPLEIAQAAETQRKAFKTLKLVEIEQAWKCDMFDISDPVEYITTFIKTFNYVLHPHSSIEQKGSQEKISVDYLVNDIHRSMSVFDMRKWLSTSIIKPTVEKLITDIIVVRKKKFLKEFSISTQEQMDAGYVEFQKLARNFLGKDSSVRKERLAGNADTYDMEECALYTFLAQVKYNVINTEPNDHLQQFVPHIYSPRKGLGKSFVMNKLFDIKNMTSGLGLFTTQAKTKDFLDDRGVDLIRKNNVIILDDFDHISEEKEEIWKSRVTDDYHSYRPFHTQKTEQFTTMLSVMTIGNSPIGKMIYNEKGERRNIQLHVDGETSPGSRKLPADLYENIDYNLIWHGIDADDYNLVWTEYPDTVKEAQHEQASETWWDDFVEYLVQEELAMPSAETAVGKFIKKHYIDGYCQHYNIKGHTNTTVKSRMKDDTNFGGYGYITYNVKQNKYRIMFNYNNYTQGDI